MFYSGRATCFAGMPQTTDWTVAGVGKGCGTIHVWDPSVTGSDDQNAAKIAKVADLEVFGARGEGSEHGVLGLTLDPDFTNGRPYLYVQYHPYCKGELGTATSDPAKQLGPGLDRLALTGERRVSRFTYDPQTKKLVPGSERVIFHWMTQVYSASRLGGAMDWDSAGNLYIATGDTIDGATNAYRGGYTNAHPEHTVPGTGAEVTISDARGTAANTKAYEGKVLRVKPLADPGPVPGLDKTYTIPGADAPNGPNLFPADDKLCQAGDLRDGRLRRALAGHRRQDGHDLRRVDRHRAAEQRGPVGPGEDRDRRAASRRRQLWLAVLRRRQPLQLPRDAAGHRRRRRGQPRLAGHARAAPSAAAPTTTTARPARSGSARPRTRSRTTRRTTPAAS